MNKIVIVPTSDEMLIQKRNKRGAKVYGMPVSKELVSYIDDAAPQAIQQRLIDMFFAGNYSPISYNEDEEYEEEN
ncbi:MAG: hypothetical protein HUK23_03295 [Sphaerochaetaceae bacterium]|nr:hypothetical protein [Sphaerochaetaceae bacterium]